MSSGQVTKSLQEAIGNIGKQKSLTKALGNIGMKKSLTKALGKTGVKMQNEETGSADASSSSARPAKGHSRGRSPSKPEKGSPSLLFQKRYLSRGYHS